MINIELNKNDFKTIKKIIKTDLYVDTVVVDGDINRIRFYIYSNKTILNVSDTIYKLFQLEVSRYNFTKLKTEYKENSIFAYNCDTYIIDYVNSYLKIMLDIKDVKLFAIQL